MLGHVNITSHNTTLSTYLNDTEYLHHLYFLKPTNLRWSFPKIVFLYSDYKFQGQSRLRKVLYHLVSTSIFWYVTEIIEIITFKWRTRIHSIHLLGFIQRFDVYQANRDEGSLLFVSLNKTRYAEYRKKRTQICRPQRWSREKKKSSWLELVLSLSQVKHRGNKCFILLYSLILIFPYPVFIVCHSIKWVPNLYELQQPGIPGQDYEWPPWIREFVLYYYIILLLYDYIASSTDYKLVTIVLNFQN